MAEKKIHTLLIDDDKNLLTSLSDILEFKGFMVHRAETGKKALQLIDNQTVDVAMIDLRLEDIPGIELLKEIKKRSPMTECILLTGYASQSSAIDAIQSGAFGYFQKPFDIEQVVLSILQAGEKSQSAYALAASERRLRSLIEYGRDNIILISREGKVFWASPSISEIWGYPPESIQNEDIFKIMHPEEKENLIPLLQQLIKEPGSRVDRQFRVLHGDGVWRWAEGSAVNLLEDPSVGGIVINFRDITEQKAINDRLWLQGSALEAAANAIVIADIEGNIIWINPAFTRLTGYSLEEAMGENPRFLKSGEQSKEFYEQLWDTIRSGNVWQSELINKKKDGTKYVEEMTITPLVDEHGDIEYFIAIKQDISHRKQIEKTLSLSEARYRSIFE